MTRDEPRSVVSVKPGMDLAVDASGRWVAVLRDGRVMPVAECYLWLLPLLEQSHVDIVQEVGRETDAEPSPVPAVLRYGLVESTTYWKGMALGWLEEGFPTDSFTDVLERMKDDRSLPQPLRHRALRLWLSALGRAKS